MYSTVFRGASPALQTTDTKNAPDEFKAVERGRARGPGMVPRRRASPPSSPDAASPLRQRHHYPLSFSTILVIRRHGQPRRVSDGRVHPRAFSSSRRADSLAPQRLSRLRPAYETMTRRVRRRSRPAPHRSPIFAYFSCALTSVSTNLSPTRERAFNASRSPLRAGRARQLILLHARLASKSNRSRSNNPSLAAFSLHLLDLIHLSRSLAFLFATLPPVPRCIRLPPPRARMPRAIVPTSRPIARTTRHRPRVPFPFPFPFPFVFARVRSSSSIRCRARSYSRRPRADRRRRRALSRRLERVETCTRARGFERARLSVERARRALSPRRASADADAHRRRGRALEEDRGRGRRARNRSSRVARHVRESAYLGARDALRRSRSSSTRGSRIRRQDPASATTSAARGEVDASSDGARLLDRAASPEDVERGKRATTSGSRRGCVSGLSSNAARCERVRGAGDAVFDVGSEGAASESSGDSGVG